MTFRIALFFLGLSAVQSVDAQVASVEITPAGGTIVAGQSLQLAVRAKDAAGNVIDAGAVTWLSGPFEIAAVNQKGLVRAFRQGALKVLARVGGKVGVSELTLLPKPAVKVLVGAERTELVPGGLLTLRPTALTEDDEPLLP